MGKFMTSRFKSKCAETGLVIKKGDPIYFSKYGYAYCESSKFYKESKESAQTFAHVKANEDAYYDNFCYRNNI
jgi:hypothetical protein